MMASRLARLVPRALTRREAYGACALGLLASLFAASEIGAAAEARRAALAGLRAERAAAASVGEEDVWADRAALARSRLDAWQAKAWGAETPGVAAAQAAEALEAIAARSGARGEASVEPEPVLRTGRPVLRFELSARLLTDDAFAVLTALAAHEPNLVATEVRMQLGADGRTQLEVRGLAPLRTPAALGGAS